MAFYEVFKSWHLSGFICGPIRDKLKGNFRGLWKFYDNFTVEHSISVFLNDFYWQRNTKTTTWRTSSWTKMVSRSLWNMNRVDSWVANSRGPTTTFIAFVTIVTMCSTAPVNCSRTRENMRGKTTSWPTENTSSHRAWLHQEQMECFLV